MDARGRHGDDGVGRRRGLGDVRGPHADTERRSSTRCPTSASAIASFTRKHTQGGAVRGRHRRAASTLAPVNTRRRRAGARAPRGARLLASPTACPSGRTLRAPGPFVRAVAHAGRARRARRPTVGEHTAAGAPPRAAPRRRRRTAPPAPAAAAPALRRRQGRRLLLDRRRADHGQVRSPTTAPPSCTSRPSNPADRLRLVGPFKDDVAGHQPLPVLRARSTRRSCRCSSNLKHPEGLEVAKRLLAWADVCLDSFTAGTMDAARPRLRRGARAEPGHHHGEHVPDGTDRPGRAARRLRLPRRRRSAASTRSPAGTTAPPARSVQRLHRHDRAALPRRDADRRARPPPPHRRGPVHRPGADGVGAALPRARAARRARCSGTTPRRAGNDAPDAAPHDAYPCAGDDQWCAIAVETDAQWRALRARARRPGVGACDRRSTPPPAAVAQRELIDRELAAFTAAHEPRALMDAAAGGRRPGRHGAALERPHARSAARAPRASSAASSTPRWARCPYEGHQFRIAGYDNGPRFPAPCLGEHSMQVLQEVLGLDDEELARVAASGALS